MKTKIAILILGILLCCGEFASAYDYVYFDDGQNHLIGDNIYQNSNVILDSYVTNNPGTHFDIIDGANINYLGVCGYSTIKVDGGSITSGIGANDGSKIEISGGIIGTIWSEEQSFVAVNGGAINGSINTSDHSMVEVHGGTFTIASYLRTYGGIIYLYGSDFSIDGTQLHYGDSLRDYGVIGGPNFAYLVGTVTGTLSDGSLLNNEFQIGGGDIIIIPEPTTCTLLVASVFLLRRRR